MAASWAALVAGHFWTPFWTLFGTLLGPLFGPRSGPQSGPFWPRLGPLVGPLLGPPLGSFLGLLRAYSSYRQHGSLCKCMNTWSLVGLSVEPIGLSAGLGMVWPLRDVRKRWEQKKHHQKFFKTN